MLKDQSANGVVRERERLGREKQKEDGQNEIPPEAEWAMLRFPFSLSCTLTLIH